MDIKTLVLALALGNLSLCAALFFFEYERKKSLSMSTWAVAKQCQAVAWCLLYFRGVLPDFLSILLGNSLLFAGMALDAGALWQAAGRGGWRRYVLPALGLSVALFAACYLFDVAPLLRSAGGSLIVAGFFLAGVAALCLKWREASMLRRFLVVSMGILSLLIAARGVLAASVPGFDAELMQLAAAGPRAGSGGACARRVLDDYSGVMLGQFIAVSAACTVLSYSLYTVSRDTIAVHGTANLIYTVPFVVYGIFRYLFLLHLRAQGNDTAHDLLTDRHLLLTVASWLAVTIGVLP
ncbi:MAG: hypothetical protein RSH52_06145 [Janthinobacterium sp.]